MTDVPTPVASGEALLDSALRPRRFGTAVVALRRVAWPVVRGWLLPMSTELNRLNHRSQLQSMAMHEELAMARTEIADLRARLDELSNLVTQGAERERAELSAVSAARDGAVENLRREVLALGNVVSHYRMLVDTALAAGEERAGEG